MALDVALAPLIGLSLGVQQLCGSQPPQMPTLDPVLQNNTIPVLFQALQAAAWPYYCQCVPGSPAPINFPAPTFTPPAGWPTAPTFSCDPANLCATLTAILQTLNQMSMQIGSTGQLVTFLQRYGLPFATILGATHSALSGSGQFAISRLIGIQANVTAKPTNTRVLQGNPPYNMDLGWMALSSRDGMLIEKRVTRDTFTWLPVGAQNATLFSWSLTPGTTMNCYELEAEP